MRVFFQFYLSEAKPINSLPKGTPKSLLKQYSQEERRRASKMQKVISNSFDSNEEVHVNLVFVSVAFSKDDSFFPSENPGKFIFNSSTFSSMNNLVFFFHKTRKFMDAGGRVYKNWNDYLRNNHLEQGVMIYPKDGTYTPDNGKVTLVASETHSCKPSEKLKNIIDIVVFGTGLLLAGAAVVTAVPLATFSAATLVTISTGSYWIGMATTAYSVTVYVL